MIDKNDSNVIETSVVHFSVDYEHLTEIIRDEWRGFNLDWAIEALESAGLPDRESINDVLSGKKKMINVGPCEGQLEDDNDPKSNDETSHAYGFIVDPSTYQVGTAHVLRRGLESIRKIRADIIYRINCYNQELHALRSAEIAEQLWADYPEKVYVDCGFPAGFVCLKKMSRVGKQYFIDLDMVREYINEDFIYWDASYHKGDKLGQKNSGKNNSRTYQNKLEKMCIQQGEIVQDQIEWFEEMLENKLPAKEVSSQSLMTIALSGDVEVYVQKQMELENTRLPDPIEPSKNINGYITPDGKYYGCGSMEHNWLCVRIEDELSYKEEELVKCAQSQISPQSIGVHIPPNEQPTDEQLLTVAQWCIAHEQKLPLWARKGERNNDIRRMG